MDVITHLSPQAVCVLCALLCVPCILLCVRACMHACVPRDKACLQPQGQQMILIQAAVQRRAESSLPPILSYCLHSFNTKQAPGLHKIANEFIVKALGYTRTPGRRAPHMLGVITCAPQNSLSLHPQAPPQVFIRVKSGRENIKRSLERVKKL